MKMVQALRRLSRHFLQKCQLSRSVGFSWLKLQNYFPCFFCQLLFWDISFSIDLLQWICKRKIREFALILLNEIDLYFTSAVEKQDLVITTKRGYPQIIRGKLMTLGVKASATEWRLVEDREENVT